MNDFVKRMLSCWSGGHYDLDKNSTVSRDVGNLYKKQLRKAVIECYIRLAVAVLLLSAPSMGQEFDRSQYSLQTCHVRVIEGLIFVSMAEEAPPFVANTTSIISSLPNVMLI